MSYPFFIWTMQRTGGTALTELLMEMSEHKAAEHEPFVWSRAKPRQFWPVVEQWKKTKDTKKLGESLSEILDEKYNIKHCYELLEPQVNEGLIRASSKSNYRHVILSRQDEYSRLFSKFIAENNGTWFKDYAKQIFTEVSEGRRTLAPLPVDKMVAHLRHCREATQAIREGLAEHGVNAKEIYYEDLYSGDPGLRLTAVHSLLEFLGFTPADINEHHDLIDQKIFHSGQNTRNVFAFVPNRAEVTRALADEGCLPIASAEAEEAPEAQSEEGVPSASTSAETPQAHSASGLEQASGLTHLTGPPARRGAEIARLIKQHGIRGPILEIVSDIRDLATAEMQDLNGEERHVIGLGDGPHREGVTFHKGNARDMKALFEDGKFGAVISNRVLAHDRKFWQTMGEIARVLAPGGAAIVITPCFSAIENAAGVTAVGRKGNPFTEVTVTERVGDAPDYWRMSPQAIKKVIFDGFDVKAVRVKMVPPHVFGVGMKSA